MAVQTNYFATGGTQSAAKEAAEQALAEGLLTVDGSSGGAGNDGTGDGGKVEDQQEASIRNAQPVVVLG